MNIIALVAGTALIIVVSWFLSVKHKRYHGIPRFFVFESLLLLFLMNYKIWFVDPLSARQLISWSLLIIAAWVAIYGFMLLKNEGKPDSNFENTSRIVKKGLYKYIRHPLYLSLFLLGIGIILKNPEPVQLLLGLVILVAVYVTSRMEEGEMIEKFGTEYRQYMTETKMFVPFIL